MVSKIFINLPVKNLGKSIEFYKKLGFSINPKFTDENAACVVIGDKICVMILTSDKFKEFTKKEIPDKNTESEVINAIQVNSKEEVDEIYNKALSSEGKKAYDFTEYDFMYGRAFLDLDGHIWEVFWMDEEKMQKQ